MFDLAKALSVEEDEEFKFIENDALYRVHNNSLEYWVCGGWELSKLTINEILKYKINKKWRPKVGEKYYTIVFNGISTESYPFSNNTIDKKLLQAGLIFKTEKEAKDMVNYLLNKIKEYREND